VPLLLSPRYRDCLPVLSCRDGVYGAIPKLYAMYNYMRYVSSLIILEMKILAFMSSLFRVNVLRYNYSERQPGASKRI
jgi:hypothetical protein